MLQSCRPEETQGPIPASKGLVEETVGNPRSWEGTMTTGGRGQTAALVKLKKQTRSTKNGDGEGRPSFPRPQVSGQTVPLPVARPSQEVLSPRPS